MENQRHLYSLNENQIYLNGAYKSPLLKSAEEAAFAAIVKARNPSQFTAADFFTEAKQARELFGQLINCEADAIAIIPSTSYGFASILNNLPAKRNGHALSIEDEFPSGFFSLKRWCNNNHNDLKIVKPNPELNLKGENWNQKIIAAINEDTSVVLMSSVHWMHGIAFDLNAIGDKCKSVNAKFILDGTQTVGAIPIDVNSFHVDAIICASYKWMLGPYSMGLAYIGEAFYNGVPIEESWMNRTNGQDFSNLTNYDYNYRPKASRYTVGEKSNLSSIPILIQGLTQLNKWGVQNMNNYVNQLVQPLISYLKEIEVPIEPVPYLCPHLLGLKLPDHINQNKLKENLQKANIVLSVRGPILRVSPNVYNTSDDIQKLISVIKESF